jgi:fluoride exporter
MKNVFLVGVGGFIGSMARFKLGGLVLRYSADGKFPASTLVVNVLGCLIAGVLFGLTEKQNLFSASARLFLFTGLLGGFTTFSAFGLETFALLRRGAISLALMNAFLSVGLGVVMVWLGFKLGSFSILK